MKFLSILLAMSLSLSSFAGIAEDVAALGDLAMGSNFVKVQGKDAKAMFINYMDGGFDEDRFMTKEIDDMDYGDEVDYGFTSVKSAELMNGFASIAFEEALENSEGSEAIGLKAKLQKLDRNWSPLIKRLSSQGVKFAYSGHGPGYCGVSFVQLIIVDVKGKKVYEVYLSNSGEC